MARSSFTFTWEVCALIDHAWHDSDVKFEFAAFVKLLVLLLRDFHAVYILPFVSSFSAPLLRHKRTLGFFHWWVSATQLPPCHFPVFHINPFCHRRLLLRYQVAGDRTKIPFRCCEPLYCTSSLVRPLVLHLCLRHFQSFHRVTSLTHYAHALCATMLHRAFKITFRQPHPSSRRPHFRHNSRDTFLVALSRR